MKKLSLIILILTTINVFSQEVNFRRVQNSMIIDFNTGDTLSRHASDAEAMQQLLNYKKEGRVVKMIGSIYEVDVYDVTTPQPDWDEMLVIDTVQVTGFNYSSIRSPGRAVINYGSNILVASKDTAVNVPYYTFTTKLEQTKHWPTATTSYKVIDFPFFFHKSDSVYATDNPTIMKARTFGNKTHCIRHYINGNEIKGTEKFETISCNAGPSTYGGGSYRHTNTFYDLKRDIDNVIRVEAIDSVSGQVLGAREFIISKL